MLRKVLQIGNPLLREQSQIVDVQNLGSAEIESLKQDLLDTLRAQKAGVAISAVQIGKPIQLFLVEIKPTPNRPELKPLGPLYFFNPELIKASEEAVDMYEACLSIVNAELFGNVTRPKSISVKYVNEEGKTVSEEFDGFLARVIQHELAHLRGELFSDYVIADTLATAEEYRKQMSKKKSGK
jgi:peptide deformylase